MQLYANDRSTPAAKNCAEACPRGATHTQGQGWQPRAPGCNGTGVAKRSYPTSEVRGGSREELPYARGQGRQPQGATPCRRSGAAAETSNLMSKAQRLHFAGAAVKRHPTPKVRETQVRQWVLREGIRGQTH